MGSRSAFDGVVSHVERELAALPLRMNVVIPLSSEPVTEAGHFAGLAIICQLDTSGSQLRVRVAGDVDLVTAPTLAEALELAQRHVRMVADVTEIVVDLRPVTFLCAAGLTELVRAYRGCLLDAVLLRVVADQRVVTRPLRLTGLDEMLTLRDDPDSALRGEQDVAYPSEQLNQGIRAGPQRRPRGDRA